MRDAHDPDRVYVQITSEDDAVLERNRAIRNARLMQIGQRAPALGDEHADVSASFQFPTVTDFQLAKAKHPDIFAELELGGEHSIRAGEKLAILFPQYVTMVRRRDRVAVSS